MAFPPQPVDFDGTTNAWILNALGAVDVGSGITMAALWRPSSTGTYDAMLSVEDAGAAPTFSFLLTDLNALYFENNGGGNANSGATSAADGVWHILAVTKPAGTVVPRFHLYNFNTSAWTRIDGLSTVNDTPATTVTRVVMGLFFGGSHPADSYGGAWAIWGDPLSDAQLDKLPLDFAEWEALAPQAFWVARGSTALDDLMGSADETSRGSGVTAGAVTSPVTWNSAAVAWMVA